MTAPTPGRIVLYTLSEDDALAVNRRRDDFATWHAGAGVGFDTGLIAHVGNATAEGNVYPAMIVRVWSRENPDAPVNLQVHLDGNDTYWAPSRIEGTGPGSWAWPERVSM